LSPPVNFDLQLFYHRSNGENSDHHL